MDASAIEAAQEDGCFAEVTVSRNLRLVVFLNLYANAILD